MNFPKVKDVYFFKDSILEINWSIVKKDKFKLFFHFFEKIGWIIDIWLYSIWTLKWEESFTDLRHQYSIIFQESDCDKCSNRWSKKFACIELKHKTEFNLIWISDIENQIKLNSIAYRYTVKENIIETLKKRIISDIELYEYCWESFLKEVQYMLLEEETKWDDVIEKYFI